MRADAITIGDISQPRARRIRLQLALARAQHEAAEYAFVGAWRASRHHRKRAARLAYRLSMSWLEELCAD